MNSLLKTLFLLVLLIKVSYSETTFTLKEMKYYISTSPNETPEYSSFTRSSGQVKPGDYVYYMLVGERPISVDETHLEAIKMSINISQNVAIYYEEAEENLEEYKEAPYLITPRSDKVIEDINGINFTHPKKGNPGSIILEISGNNNNEDEQDKYYADFVEKIEIVIVTQVNSY